MTSEPMNPHVTRRVSVVPLLQLGSFRVQAVEYEMPDLSSDPQDSAPITVRCLEFKEGIGVVGKLRPLQVEEFAARLLAWLWEAHTDETRELARHVTRQLVAWREGAADPMQVAHMLQVLGVVHVIHDEPQEAP